MKTYLVIIVIAVSFLLSACGGESNSENNTQTETVAQVSNTAPAKKAAVSFSGYDTAGTKRHSSEWLAKQPVVVNFWGTWCPPCRHEIPALVKLYEEYNEKGIEIVSIAFNNRDNAQSVSKFAEQNKMHWVLLLGDIDVAKQFQIQSVPTTIFFDKDGNFKKVWDPITRDSTARISGARDYETFKSMFDQLL